MTDRTSGILAAMRFGHPTFRTLFWIATFALFMVRTSDAHIHMCFDGQEPTRSLHVDDAPGSHHADHDASDVSQDHQDQDVELVGPLAAKNVVHVDDIQPLAVASVLILLAPPDRQTRFETVAQDPAPRLPDLFLPLLRGPPT